MFQNTMPQFWLILNNFVKNFCNNKKISFETLTADEFCIIEYLNVMVFR